MINQMKGCIIFSILKPHIDLNVAIVSKTVQYSTVSFYYNHLL